MALRRSRAAIFASAAWAKALMQISGHDMSSGTPEASADLISRRSLWLTRPWVKALKSASRWHICAAKIRSKTSDW